MTEEEAKTKWCPFARVLAPIKEIGSDVILGVAAANRASFSKEIGTPGVDDRTTPPSARCIGSACMAWRGGLWERVDRPAAMGPPEGDGWVKDGQESGLGGAVTNRQCWKREQFFCGLAGKP